MADIAFATSRDYAALAPDDRLAADRLRALGAVVRPVIWTDDDASLEGCGSVIIRSCWDYHLAPAQFLAWTRSASDHGVNVWNSPVIVGWNTDKGYLREVAAGGVAIPETVWLERGATSDLAGILADRGWDRAVVKPAISATAWRTFVTQPASAAGDQPALDEVLRHSGALVQRFVDGIERDGEWSLIYFDGVFSHAVVKRPVPGDFRVQEQFGGWAEPRMPAGALLEQAGHALRQAPERPLYARVDGVDVGGRFTVMELELIEPSLFLGTDAQAADRFARAILARV